MSYWNDKVALVTGGSSGFGRTMAEALVGAGASLVIADVDAGRLEETVEQLGSQGHDVAGFPADVTKEESVQTLVEQAIRRFGRLDLLANIVGRSARGQLLDTTPEDFRELLDLNFISVVHGTRAAVPHLIKTRGHVVNMGSLAAKSAARFLGAYPVSKFSVAAYSQQLRYELGPQGVHVLLVCPGPLTRSDAGSRYEEQAAGLPEAAQKPGGGVRLKGISPKYLAARVLTACQRRAPELVVPFKARLLFAILQLWPSLGDRIVARVTSGDARG